jgi:hypothetical protein
MFRLGVSSVSRDQLAGVSRKKRLSPGAIESPVVTAPLTSGRSLSRLFQSVNFIGIPLRISLNQVISMAERTCFLF